MVAVQGGRGRNIPVVIVKSSRNVSPQESISLPDTLYTEYHTAVKLSHSRQNFPSATF